jgi:hypothetical protein
MTFSAGTATVTDATAAGNRWAACNDIRVLRPRVERRLIEI